ncbi:MAG: uridine kinase [Planctomycetota bacterium]
MGELFPLERFEKRTVVGVAGGSASGKSTVVKNIMSRLGEDNYVVLDNDSYYKNLPHLSEEDRAKANYDHPSSLDQVLFLEHIRDLKSGRSVRKPQYDFVHHQRSPNTLQIEPKQIIIVEGILILEDEIIRNEMDIKIFVDTDPDIRLIRRLSRDMKTRGRSLEMIINQYLLTVKPMYEKFVEPTKKYADIIIPRGGNNLVAIDMVISRLLALLPLK